MASTTKEIATEILPFMRVYKDGSVDRLLESPLVPTSPGDPETGVSSKDISISLNPAISARLFLPPLNHNNQKLPVLVYFHGGGFCFESAFSSDHHRFLNSLVSQAKVLAVSVEYRLAPEYPLPVAYEDCWYALQWVASHNSNHDDRDDHDQDITKETWLTNHGDFEKVFLGGDSAGANIVHSMAMRFSKEDLNNRIKSISGAFLTHPYFWGSEPLVGSSEPCAEELAKSIPRLVWDFVYPCAPGGVDNPMINPVGPDAPSLAGLGAGANIVHNVALRAGTESESLPCNVKIHGAFLAHPYFWGSKPIGSEPKEGFENALERLVWDFAYPSASWGIDNLMINPVSGGGAPSLAGLGCSRMLVCVAGKDRLRERGVWYYEAVKESGWKGEVELFEVEEEDHAFHIYNIDSHNANVMIKRLASFLV
ncbi:putative carboxylesterase 12 [Morus notabilis]|uniref:Putative carboxylesterase 12 n=1 Tax=Morus notabilis TaxID=981085 RepID=W9S910_9ROSA|nr:putative carboxylesterase 12 [Morus notabilis]